jgi:hypothetical protein
MGQIVPAPVEEYLARLNRLPDSQLKEMARAGVEQDLPLIDAEVGGLLRVLATAIGATRMLEIGTAIGYSGIWLAGGFSGGMLITMEMDPEAAPRRGIVLRALACHRVGRHRRAERLLRESPTVRRFCGRRRSASIRSCLIARRAATGRAADHGQRAVERRGGAWVRRKRRPVARHAVDCGLQRAFAAHLDL